MKNESQNTCCCGPSPCCPPPEKKSIKTPYISGYRKTSQGEIPIIETRLSLGDRLGGWKVRWGIGRMKYRVDPGLYAAGDPSEKSPVFVTANFKMSFDRLRSNLDGIDSWVLVLDTRGINVWCAAGKGTFGTAELVNRIGLTCLQDIVSHRKLIVPQLGATGVSAHEVKNLCGFNIHYGPIRAEDIPAYVKAGFRATPEMRKVNFPIGHRLALVPTEWSQSFKYLFLAALVLFLISGLSKEVFSFEKAAAFGIPAIVILSALFILGYLLPPLLLPWLPGRPFSVKGAWVGAIFLIFLGAIYSNNQSLFPNAINAASWIFIILAIVSFQTMNFTGSTTFTSLSGVQKEMKFALPIQISAAAVGLIGWTISMVV